LHDYLSGQILPIFLAGPQEGVSFTDFCLGKNTLVAELMGREHTTKETVRRYAM